jgi:hypothetical protein
MAYGGTFFLSSLKSQTGGGGGGEGDFSSLFEGRGQWRLMKVSELNAQASTSILLASSQVFPLKLAPTGISGLCFPTPVCLLRFFIDILLLPLCKDSKSPKPHEQISKFIYPSE